MNTCPKCGRTVHEGGCDVQAFYHWQRFGKVLLANDDAQPPPPRDGLPEQGGGMNEPPPLSLQTDLSIPVFVNPVSKRKQTKPQGTIKVVSKKVKGVDSPEIIARRIAIREARVKNLERARTFRKKKKL